MRWFVAALLLVGCRATAAPEPTPTASVQGAREADDAERSREQACLDNAPAKKSTAPAPASVPSRELAAPAPVDPGPTTGCTVDVDALPIGRGATARDTRRLHEERVLVAQKSARRMMLYDAGVLEACWVIGLGFTPVGHKRVEGDGTTPEGWYPTSDKPWSLFDNAIAIHYPANRDAVAARRDGRIGRKELAAISAANRRGAVPPQQTAMGGEVLIHGGGSSSDWTLGCIALDDDDLVDLRSRLGKSMRTKLLVVP